MGYTHYWTFKRDLNTTASDAETAHQQAVKDCTKVLRAMRKEGVRLSGYSANSVKQYGGLKVNGPQGDDCEDFIIMEHFSQNGNDFCKTGRHEYDSAVSACLAILKWRLGESFSVSSDGDAQDWQHGVELARRILNRKSIKNPLGDVQPKVSKATINRVMSVARRKAA